MFDQTWGYLQPLFKFISRLLLKFVLLIMQLFLLLLLPSFKRFSDFFPWCDDIESLNHSFHWNSLFKTKNMCQLSDFFFNKMHHSNNFFNEKLFMTAFFNIWSPHQRFPPNFGFFRRSFRKHKTAIPPRTIIVSPDTKLTRSSVYFIFFPNSKNKLTKPKRKSHSRPFASRKPIFFSTSGESCQIVHKNVNKQNERTNRNRTATFPRPRKSPNRSLLRCIYATSYPHAPIAKRLRG